ncbi:uncharacterized protein LOC34618665 [Cyclospora cayetanensis]|uniref:Uncharacterized protein LOC34618665 n=2 Tax=Cyclospora cayetanensis TaxID=88456 RepID=A0A6P5WCB0_9EIME|nr:uncharacterized protein LOC34618665 [Cyclospora cayetanensis]OEH73982.1 hypothetical protein cyc_01701 [Cyclospora cayetanensis]
MGNAKGPRARVNSDHTTPNRINHEPESEQYTLILNHGRLWQFVRANLSKHPLRKPIAPPAKPSSSSIKACLSSEENTNRADLDAWFEAEAMNNETEITESRELQDTVGVLTNFKEQASTKDVTGSLQEFLDCVKQLQGSVTKEFQVLSHALFKHSVGLTSATSFAEVQHHLTEIVHLSGPELGCVWSTVKVGVGLLTVFSGNLLIGSFVVALAVGSFGTSLMWKAYRDSRKKFLSFRKTREHETKLSAWTLRRRLPPLSSTIIRSKEQGECSVLFPNASRKEPTSTVCELLYEVLAEDDAWSVDR